MRLGAIILAGGRSTRMGRAKDSLPYGGSTLLGHIATTLLRCTGPVVVVARDASQPLPPLPSGVARCHDAVADGGPLAGIAAGMQWLAGPGGHEAADAAFVTACDHPLLVPAFVRLLADHLGDGDAAVPCVADELQPLCAIYRLRTLPTVAAMAAAAAGPRDLLPHLATRIVPEAALRRGDPTLASLRNVNTPAEYGRLPPQHGGGP